MSPQQYIVIPIFIALQAFIMMVVTPFVPGNPAENGMAGPGLITWVAFQAWAMYFLAGCKPSMALKVLAGYACGIVASIAIFELAGLLSGLNVENGPAWGLYVAVFLVVIPVICAEKVPGINFIPAWFVGAGVCFALATHCGATRMADISNWAWYGQIATAELIACAIGLFFGWGTVTFRGWYEGLFAKEDETAEAADPTDAAA